MTETTEISTQRQHELARGNLERLGVTEIEPRRDPKREVFKTDEQAYEAILARDDERAVKELTTETPKPAEAPELETPSTPSASGEVSLTATEIHVRDELRACLGQLQQFDAAVAQKYGAATEQEIRAKLAELEKTDRARAVALRSDFNDEMRGRQQFCEQLQQAGQQWTQQVQGRLEREAANQVSARHKRERAKLLSEAPELRSKPVAVAFVENHLIGRRGYSETDIGAVLDHRPILAEFHSWRAEHPEEIPKLTIPRQKPKGKIPRVKRPQPNNVTDIATRSVRNETEMDRAYRKLIENRRAAQ